ncbi:hypothetical protein VP01_1863g5 [Puccinia sorghi]|uniref:Uncharacterized protein n=1 Tax=Puccinia sorghi TaxID=27349 RepID=A0A0L6VDC9_9BASI|nr:hypothetical protein VP01_1863g5 [Puccinia sorghi]
MKARIGSSWLIRIRMAYLRLVLVYYYTHPETKGLQWAAINERLALLRKFLPGFESMDIPIEKFTIPSVAEVKAAIIRKQSTRNTLTEPAN